MDKIKNFEIVVNTCLAGIDPKSEYPEFDKNDFLLSVVNGFEDNKWRENEFRNFVMNNVALTGLSAEDREKHYASDRYSQITAAIRNLRLVDVANGQGSEIAEIVLYGIMRWYYKALPVVPKIFYKQNPNDPAKGADSVHIVVDDDAKDFTLWIGEAKFYNDISDERLYNPIKSVFNAIATNNLKKENSIITSVRDLEYVIPDPDIRAKVLDVLHLDTSIDEVKNRLHVPILLLHECEKTRVATGLTQEYLQAIKTYHLERAVHYYKFHNKKQEKEKVAGFENIKFHLILFPVPDKDGIVEWFIKRAKQIKEDA